MKSHPNRTAWDTRIISGEIWMPSPHAGYPYDVSNMGRVRRHSLASDRVRKKLPNRNYEPHILWGGLINGYRYVTMTMDGMPHKHDGVHELVLLAFIGPRPDGYYGCHKNGNRADNRLDNLKWATPTENQEDRVRHGNDQIGENNGSVKLSDKQVGEIRKMREETGLSYRKIARKFNASTSNVHLICTGQSRNIPTVNPNPQLFV
jgi:hypothetical protein